MADQHSIESLWQPATKHQVDPEIGDQAVEPVQRPTRRSFTEDYKAMVLRVTDNLPNGELGRFLRQEGLYRSHLVQWRRERRRAAGEAVVMRGRPPKPQEQRELERLERENVKLRKDLERARAVIEIQKKLSELLGPSPGDHPLPP